MSGTYACRACRGTDVAPLLDFGTMPIAHRMLASAAESEERFPFVLSGCATCGLMQIVDPIDPEILYKGFNFNLSSWKREAHREDEIALIVRDAAPESVLEIAPNDGTFMDELRAAGVKTLVGIEPNPFPAALARERGFTIHESWIDETISHRVVAEHGGPFDAVVCRQALEHMPHVDLFFESVRILVKDDGYLFVDLPNMEPPRDAGDCSVLWEEHVSYYTRPQLEGLMRTQGFEPVAFRAYNFAGGTMAVLARRVPQRLDRVPADPGSVAAASDYAARVRAYGARLNELLARAAAAGYVSVLYGVGVRACGLTNALRIGHLAYAIDDQPERQGKFMPGTHLEVRSSAALGTETAPTIVLLAVNAEFEDRVRARVAEFGGRPIHALSVCSPNDIHAELDALEALLAQTPAAQR